MIARRFTLFDYLYRDAGNFKAYGALLLEGSFGDAELEKMRGRFDSGLYFVAEQIYVPPLYDLLWKECESAPCGDLDHVWHEFEGVHPATESDIASMKPWGRAQQLLALVADVREWNLKLSPNWFL